MKDNVIEISEFSLSFGGQVVLEKVDLEVAEKSLIAICGPSGSGKSSLLRSLNRLNECFEGASVSGTVKLFFDDRWVDIYKDPIFLPYLRRRVQMVFQSPHVLPTTVEKNILMPMKMGGSFCREVMEEALEAVGLLEEVKDRLKKPAATLSGGQQGRLCLARALALKPQILLLDEPTANLDETNRAKIEKAMKRLAQTMTIVFVTHDLDQARRLSDEIFEM